VGDARAAVAQAEAALADGRGLAALEALVGA
jgi:hypothetical protein